MIVINDKPGQLCNRIWAIVPFVAAAVQHGTRLIVPTFGEYTCHFDNLHERSEVTILRSHGRVYFRLLRMIFAVLRAMPVSMQRALNIYVDRARWGVEQWSQDVLSRRGALVILSSWNQPKPPVDVMSQHAAIIAIFRPRKTAIDRVDRFLQTVRRDADIVVGVHVRRGDYRDFAGGAYFYTMHEYAAYMAQVRLLFAGKRVVFLVCSNEAVAFDDALELNFTRIPDADPIEDLYALGRCDYLMGPPSTFSMWASFYGQVPLRFLANRQGVVGLDDFSVVIGQDQFANGTRFGEVADNTAVLNWAI